MQKIKVACTSSSGLNPLVANFFNVDIVPILIEYQGKQYRECFDLDASKFFDLLESTKPDRYNLPKTVVPTTQSIEEILKKAIEDGFTDIIFVCMSTKLGSALNKIRVVSESFATKINIHIFDAKIIGYHEGHMALRAGWLASQGKSVKYILNELEKIRDNTYALGACNNLDYLVYNGRLKGAQAFFGKTLNIKPSLEFTREGELQSFSKSLHCLRAFDVSAAKLKEIIGEDTDYLLWRFYTGKAISKYIKRAEEKNGLIVNAPDIIMPLSTGVHTGPYLGGWGLIKNLKNFKN